MVSRRHGALILACAAASTRAALAHGDDFGPPGWEQPLADFAVFTVSTALLLGLGWQGLGPILRGEVPGTRLQRVLSAGVVLALVGALVVAVGVGTVGKIVFPPPPDPDYQSRRVERGGQVSTWGGFHVEFARRDREYRVYLTDAYRRPISPRFYRGTLVYLPGETPAPLEAGPGDYLFTATGPPAGSTGARIELEVPGRTIRLTYPLEPERRR